MKKLGALLTAICVAAGALTLPVAADAADRGVRRDAQKPAPQETRKSKAAKADKPAKAKKAKKAKKRGKKKAKSTTGRVRT